MRLRLILPIVIRKPEEKSEIDIFLTNTSDLYKSLEDYLGDRFNLIFNKDGSSKGFVRIFFNHEIVDYLRDIKLVDGGELEIITSMSGG